MLSRPSHSYKYKKTKKLMKQLTPYWLRYKKLVDRFNYELDLINKSMENANVGIPGIVLYTENNCRGIGNRDRSMELIQSFEFEEGRICR